MASGEAGDDEECVFRVGESGVGERGAEEEGGMVDVLLLGRFFGTSAETTGGEDGVDDDDVDVDVEDVDEVVGGGETGAADAFLAARMDGPKRLDVCKTDDTVLLLIFGFSPEEAPADEEAAGAAEEEGAMASGALSSELLVLVCASEDASAPSKFLDRFLTLELPTREGFAEPTAAAEEDDEDGDDDGDAVAVVVGARFFLSVVGGDEAVGLATRLVAAIATGLDAPPLFDILRVSCSVSF